MDLYIQYEHVLVFCRFIVLRIINDFKHLLYIKWLLYNKPLYNEPLVMVN